MAIVVVHRSDGSGTSYIFTDFLSHVSGEWKSKVGTGKSVSWPAPSSVGAKGTEGVAGQVKSTPGAIGYVDMAYVVENHMQAATLENKAGKWIDCTPGTVAAAAASKPEVSATNFSIVDSSAAGGYPISGYSWVVVYKKPEARAKELYNVLSWLVGSQGQENAKSVDYVPLPRNVQDAAAATLRQMQR